MIVKIHIPQRRQKIMKKKEKKKNVEKQSPDQNNTETEAAKKKNAINQSEKGGGVEIGVSIQVNNNNEQSSQSNNNNKNNKETTQTNNNNNNNNTNKAAIDKGPFKFVPDDHAVLDVYKFFNVDKELGRGASCRVLKVSRKDGDDTEKKYAMKEMKRDDKWNPMLFEQEVMILQKLAGHSNILHYEDCWMDTKNFYILTTLCTGGELFDKIKELRHFSENHAADVTRVILDAIKFSHSKNIVHRDLKPENIVFKDKNHEELVIIDFGDAKEVEDDSKHDDFVGTAFYLAPEAIRSRTGAELKKSDMWTIGVIAYVLVTGRPPFWGRENKEIIRKIIRGQVRFPSSIKLSNECKDFILALLKKEPKQRLSAEQALRHPWITREAPKTELSEDVLINLATFGTSSKLKQLIVKTVAANLDKKHRQEYEKQFNLLDVKHDNQIDYEELTSFLIKCGLDQITAEKRAISTITNIAGPQQRTISKEDWNHANVAKLLSSDHLVERQYKKLDVDEDGFISVEDLISIFEGATKEEIKEIINEIDLSDDGTINFDEFRRAMAFEPAYVATPIKLNEAEAAVEEEEGEEER